MPNTAKVIQVIATEACRGEGTPKDPCRIVMRYWTLDGKLLAEFDKWHEDERAEKEKAKR